MADEQISELVAALQLAQEIDDLRLHRHVERRGRLIENQEFRLEHERPGDGDALALAARELVRVAVAGSPGSSPTSRQRARRRARRARRG